MSNLLQSIAIILVAVTNWTGKIAEFDGATKELGYITTNHEARLVYSGQTNTFTLKTQPTDLAVWRDVPTLRVRNITNHPYLVITTNAL